MAAVLEPLQEQTQQQSEEIQYAV